MPLRNWLWQRGQGWDTDGRAVNFLWQYGLWWLIVACLLTCSCRGSCPYSDKFLEDRISLLRFWAVKSVNSADENYGPYCFRLMPFTYTVFLITRIPPSPSSYEATEESIQTYIIIANTVVRLRPGKSQTIKAFRLKWSLFQKKKKKKIENTKIKKQKQQTHPMCWKNPRLFNTAGIGSVGVETPVPARSPKLSNVEPG